MTTLPRPTVPVTDDAGLTARWRTLLDLGGPPSGRTLSMLWLRRDGTAVPLVIPIEDLPAEPDRVAIGHLVELHRAVAESEHVAEETLHLALCLQRTGPAGPSADDEAWTAAVDAVLRGRHRLDCSLHLADGRHVVPALPRLGWPAG